MIRKTKPNGQSRITGLIGNAGLTVVSFVSIIVIVFLSGEAFMRLRFGSVPPGPGNDRIQHDATIGWTLKPGQYPFFHVAALRRVDVSINDLGLRNPPITLEPPPGVLRVSVVGDSFVFAAALRNEEVLTHQLQAMAGDEYEIVNISAEQYGTGQQIRP